jgi:hypothetical protein
LSWYRRVLVTLTGIENEFREVLDCQKVLCGMDK